MQSLPSKATVRLPTHVRTNIRAFVELSITIGRGHAILATLANTIHSLTAHVKQKHAYTRHRNKQVALPLSFATALTRF